MSDPQDSFLDLSFLHADFNRPLFLQAIVQSFVDSASPAELKALRHGIRDRAIALRQTRKKGRPRAEESWTWICSTARLVWHREIDGWSWPRLARSAGLKPTKSNLRTLRNRRDQYAALIWELLPGSASDPKILAKLMGAKPIQLLLRSRLALPFDSHPQQCKRLVLKLFPRGLQAPSSRL